MPVAFTLHEAYQATSGPQGYGIVIAAILALVGQDLLGAGERSPLRPVIALTALALTVAGFAIIGLRLAALAT